MGNREIKYQRAMLLYSKRNYAEAAEIFSELDDYSGAELMYDACTMRIEAEKKQALRLVKHKERMRIKSQQGTKKSNKVMSAKKHTRKEYKPTNIRGHVLCEKCSRVSTVYDANSTVQNIKGQRIEIFFPFVACSGCGASYPQMAEFKRVIIQNKVRTGQECYITLNSRRYSILIPQMANNQSMNTFPKQEIVNESKENKKSKISKQLLYGIEDETCRKCGERTLSQKMNVGIYDLSGNFRRYRIMTIHQCKGCGEIYGNKKEQEELFNDSEYKHYQNHVFLYKPKFILTHNTDFRNMPISSFNFVFEKQPTAFHKSGKLEVKQKSFLKEAGYDTSKTELIRREILSNQIRIVGKRKVVDQISFFIDIHKNRKNEKGELIYERALEIWQSDLNYIQNLTLLNSPS